MTRLVVDVGWRQRLLCLTAAVLLLLAVIFTTGVMISRGVDQNHMLVFPDYFNAHLPALIAIIPVEVNVVDEPWGV